MSYSRLSFKEAADHLNIDHHELEKFVKENSIPFSTIQGQKLFQKDKLNEWMSIKLLTSQKGRLNKYYQKASELRSIIDNHKTFLSDLLTPSCIEPQLQAKTKPSVLRELVNCAMRTELLTDEKKLLNLLQERENLSSTALENGIALPHPRSHPPYLFLNSFIIIAKLPSGIPFGALDNQDCDLFFMPCAHDDRHHVYMLARLALMLNDKQLAESLRNASGAEEMLSKFKQHEIAITDRMKKAYKKLG